MPAFTIENFLKTATPEEITAAEGRLLLAALGLPKDCCPDCGAPSHNIFPIGEINGVEMEKCYTCCHFWPVGNRPNSN